MKVRTEQEVRDTERANILAALNKTRWKVYGRGGAAELLGIKPGTLAARMKKLGLRRSY
jgi:transcriptional regulator with GAF, ATPase, and Fis domain